MKDKILIVSNSKESNYYMPVINAINNQGCDAYLYDYNSLLYSNALSINIDQNGLIPVMCFKSKGTIENTLISFSEVKKVWPIRRGNVKTHRNLDHASRLFAEKQIFYTLNSLVSMFDCEVINKPYVAKYMQDNKLLQLRTAKECGMEIPKTLVSSCFKDVSRFIKDNGGLALVKPVFNIPFVEKEENLFYGIYSNIVTRKDISSDSVKVCPSIYQEYIDKKVELRISYAGGDMLACAIHSQSSEKTKIDWRNYDFKNVKHTTYDLPEKVKNLLIKTINKLDLQYGQIDMILTPDGRFVFLEVNPSGQWGWIQKITGLKIDESIARMLIK